MSEQPPPQLLNILRTQTAVGPPKDTALPSLLQGLQSDHSTALSSFVKWCNENFLDLNVSKTKELIIDLGKTAVSSTPVLYTVRKFWEQFRFNTNTEAVKCGQQRLHLTRKLNFKCV